MLGLIIATLPNAEYQVMIWFGSGALATGIAILAAGYVQTVQGNIAYFQEAIVIQMAAMAFGPAAMVWLRRTRGRIDYTFTDFTVLYAIIMVVYMFYTSSNSFTPDPLHSVTLTKLRHFTEPQQLFSSTASYLESV